MDTGSGLPDWHEVIPLIAEFANDGFKDIGNPLGIDFGAGSVLHLDRRIGVTTVSARLQLEHESGNDRRPGMLPDASGRRRKQGWPTREPGFHSTIKVRSIHEPGAEPLY